MIGVLKKCIRAQARVGGVYLKVLKECTSSLVQRPALAGHTPKNAFLTVRQSGALRT